MPVRSLVGHLSVALIFLAARPVPAEDWSWVDGLPNADAATKQRLKVCTTASAANYASLRRASFDFDLQHELASTDPAGKPSFVMQNYRGKVRWRGGSVRYDFEGDNPFVLSLPPDPTPEPKALKFGVIRTKDMLAYTEINPTYGTFLVVDRPPTLDDWKFQHPTHLTFIDPWVHYAPNFRDVQPSLREFWEVCRSIESDESEGVTHFRFRRGDSQGRVDIDCAAAADHLPVKTRAGEVRGDAFVVFVEVASEWRKTDGVWYPTRYTQTANYGASLRPVAQCDLMVRNLRVGGAADVSDSAFNVNTLDLPEKSGGFDRRAGKGLIKLGGVVRESRPGDPIPASRGFTERVARESSEANRQAEGVLRQRAYWGAASWSLAVVAGVVLVILARRVYLRRAGGSV